MSHCNNKIAGISSSLRWCGLWPGFLAMFACACTAMAASRAPDFNGDGFADLPVRTPGELVGGFAASGGVAVFYGSATGISTANDQFWTEKNIGIGAGAQAGDRFGSAIGWGDFNGDHFDDLAIGAPYRDVAATSDAGAVFVLYGSASGLTSTGAQEFVQGLGSANDVLAVDDHFGVALASGDFNGDGFFELAVGVPDDDAEGHIDQGLVHIILGSEDGLVPGSSVVLTQGSNGGNGDAFGRALAVGNFDADDFDDLAVGVPFGDDIGFVRVFPGSAGLFDPHDDRDFSRNSTGVLGSTQQDALFGNALAAGDFDGNGRDDLAIASTGQTVGDKANAGSINVLYGSSGGLQASNDDLWKQSASGLTSTAGVDEQFGRTMSAGDFNGDGRDELVVTASNHVTLIMSGVPIRRDDCGTIFVMKGTSSGLTTSGALHWTQDTAGVGGGARADYRFGWSLLAGDFNGSGQVDLAVGIPGYRVAAQSKAGAIQVFLGKATGLTTTGAKLMTQDSSGVADSAEANDEFGQ